MTDDLISRIVEELTDPEYASRTHGYRTTYKAGCHGPLCLKAERERGARQRAKKNPDYKRRQPEEFERLDAYLAEVIRALGLQPKKPGSRLAAQAACQEAALRVA